MRNDEWKMQNVSHRRFAFSISHFPFATLALDSTRLCSTRSPFRNIDEDLQRVLRFDQQSHHFAIVVESVDG